MSRNGLTMSSTGIAATVATGVIILAAALSGCSLDDKLGTSPPPTASPSRGVAFPSRHSPAPTGVVNEDTGETQAPRVVPSWDAESRRGVMLAAERAMSAFARPTLDRDTWWAAVEPLLTDQAARDYAYVQPRSIPAQRVSGAGRIVDDTTAYVGIVEVPTDVGRYRIVLSRESSTDRWLVSRFIPPEGVN